MQKELNLKYSISQSIDSGLYASMLAFASIFLMDKGMNNSNIGILLAITSVASIIIQTFFANFTDKHKSIQLQDIMTVLLIIVIISSAALFFVSSPIVFLIAVLIAYSFARSSTPFLNSLAFIYEDDGIHVDYGIGRAFGSLAYAVYVLVLGYVIEATSSEILPIFYIGFAVLYIMIVRSYRLKKTPLDEMKAEMLIEEEGDQETSAIAKQESIPVEQQSFAGFLNKYRKLVFVILGFVLVLFGQTMISTFMFQIVSPIGGNSSTVGIAIFIAAAAEFPAMMYFNKLLKKRSVEFWLKLSMLFFILKTITLFFATNVFMVYFSQFLQFGSYAVAYPAAVQYIKGVVDKEDLFKGQTLFTVGTTISTVFSSFFGGVIIDHFGVAAMILVSIAVTFVGGLVIYQTLDDVRERVRGLIKAQN